MHLFDSIEATVAIPRPKIQVTNRQVNLGKENRKYCAGEIYER